jgi:hypothetical protein
MVSPVRCYLLCEHSPEWVVRVLDTHEEARRRLRSRGRVVGNGRLVLYSWDVSGGLTYLEGGALGRPTGGALEDSPVGFRLLDGLADACCRAVLDWIGSNWVVWEVAPEGTGGEKKEKTNG